MKTEAKNERAWPVVQDVIHAWDPYGLIRGGAPEDEWDHEIERIVAEISTIRSADDATNLISRVFTKAFQPDRFTPSDCADVGRRLFAALKAATLVPASPDA